MSVQNRPISQKKGRRVEGKKKEVEVGELREEEDGKDRQTVRQNFYI